ncbi:MAG: hypothetical protein JO056_08085 [Alphaproteobacteria bacterium]|nr:hypothetical protein [Alphaproteobacteria bacterium]
MKTGFMAAAAFLVAGAGAASADTFRYTFADADGIPYCDGIKLYEQDDGTASGVHTNGAQCTEGDYAGGFLSRLYAGYHGKKWVITTTDVNNLPGVVELYVLDTNDMTWDVYDQDTNNGLSFQLVNSGRLLNGNPPAGRVHRGVSGRKPNS